MKKTILKDDNGKSLEVDLKEFLDHLNEYHKTGISTHTQNGCSFTVDDEFRKKIKNNLFEQIINFIEQDKLVIGICNGCQILVNLGIVPALEGYKREVALVENDIATYQCRWIKLKVINKRGPWFKEINYLYLPVAHQEGKFVADKRIIGKLNKKKLIACKYINQAGLPAKKKFPYNPNGSMEDIAAITNSKGNVLAMMPHPERALYLTQKPNWIDLKVKIDNKSKHKNELYADGYKIFKNAYNYFK